MKFRILLYIVIIVVIGNFNAVVDLIIHPDIPYFDREHFIVGGATALLTIMLLALFEACLKRQQIASMSEGIVHARIGNYGWPLAAAWTLIVIVSLIWNVILHKQRTVKIALIEAKTVFEKDLIYYRWAATHNGVYVPVSGNTQPNPYLEHISEFTVDTTTGKTLTLVNPEYMIRQVYEMQTKKYGPFGHITSLDPIRPENAADPWESSALEAFEEGVTEVSSIEEINGEKFLRLMRPMVTEAGCLKCHAPQGYELGDIRGGISVSIPMAPLLAISKQDIFTFALAHATFWLLGLLGIFIGVQRLSASIRQREQAEMRMRSIIDNMFDGLITLDVGGRVESFNSAASRLFRYPGRDLVDRHISALLMSSAENEAKPLADEGVPDEIRKAAALPRELIGLRKDGSMFNLEVSVSEMRLGGKLLFILMVRDITERNMAKDALLESQSRIIKQEKLVSLGTMVAGIAHEINNPAQAISFSMDGLKMNMEYVKEFIAGLKEYLSSKPGDPVEEREEIRELMEDLDMDLVVEGVDGIAERNIQSIERIDHIIKSTKRMAHSEETFSPCDLNTVVNDAIILTHNQVKYDLNIETDLAPSLPFFKGLAQEMGQVFMNLIMNARDAVRETGLAKKDARIRITTSYNKEKKYLEARFEDNGGGIEKEIIDKIFDPFFTTKPIGSGTGLGLNLCHRIVETHGGEIHVESEPGVGTTFIVRLFI